MLSPPPDPPTSLYFSTHPNSCSVSLKTKTKEKIKKKTDRQTKNFKTKND